VQKKSKPLLPLAAGALVLVSITMLTPPGQPSYKGIPFETWLAEFADRWRDNPESRETAEAAEAIRSMARDALPYALNWINHEDTSWRDILSRQLENLNYRSTDAIASFLQRPEDRARLAEWAFIALRSDGSNAIPKLLTLMMGPGPETNHRATMALASIGRPALPALISVLSDTNLVNRDLAAYAIANMEYGEADPKLVVPVLSGCLDDADTEVGKNAALALGELTSEPASVVPQLMRILHGKPTPVQTRAIYSLAAFGTNAGPALPLLISATQAADDDLCTAAYYAISRIDPNFDTDSPPP
jgi:hypothetical protein